MEYQAAGDVSQNLWMPPKPGFAGNDSMFFLGEKLATAAMTGPARFVWSFSTDELWGKRF